MTKRRFQYGSVETQYPAKENAGSITLGANSHLLRSDRFDVHRLEPSDPDQLHGSCAHPCGPPSPSLLIIPPQHAAFPAGPFRIPLVLIPVQPLRQRSCLQSDPLYCKPSALKKVTRVSRSLVTFASFTNFPCASTTHTLDSSNDTSTPAQYFMAVVRLQIFAADSMA
jgi:hypothetical protein